MVRADKIEFVSRIAGKLKASQSVVLADFRGITVAEMTRLRSRLRERNVELRVVKNRLLKRALADAGCDNLDDMLTGNTAVGFGMNDPTAPAKILSDYAKTNNKLVIKGGLLEGRRMDATGVRSLSKMPGRQELLARMAGDLKQPAWKVAMVFQAGLLKVVYAMGALAKKLEASGQAA
jgi:large subunit ribosomal protein L10